MPKTIIQGTLNHVCCKLHDWSENLWHSYVLALLCTHNQTRDAAVDGLSRECSNLSVINPVPHYLDTHAILDIRKALKGDMNGAGLSLIAHKYKLVHDLHQYKLPMLDMLHRDFCDMLAAKFVHTVHVDYQSVCEFINHQHDYIVKHSDKEDVDCADNINAVSYNCSYDPLHAVCFELEGVILDMSSIYRRGLPEELKINPGIADLLATLHEQGWTIIVTSPHLHDLNNRRRVKQTCSHLPIDYFVDDNPPARVHVKANAVCFDGDTDGLLENIIRFQPYNEEF